MAAHNSGGQRGSEDTFWKGYEAGYQSGYEMGKREGFQEGVLMARHQWHQDCQKDRNHFRQLLTQLAGALGKQIHEFLSRSELTLPLVALEIARQIVETEVQVNPQIVQNAVAKALQELKGTSVIVRVHPADFEVVKEVLPSLEHRLNGFPVQIVPDEAVGRGGVIAESQEGIVDLQPQTKFALLEAEIMTVKDSLFPARGQKGGEF